MLARRHPLGLSAGPSGGGLGRTLSRRRQLVGWDHSRVDFGPGLSGPVAVGAVKKMFNCVGSDQRGARPLHFHMAIRADGRLHLVQCSS
jgi:hypothetical protein